ncbi:MAG: undecaprenyl-phosphate glucose phosphotransferase [Candidatus Berkelbacteria bacterium]|nr:undecaprenyl-phosphate glucose phosphotransferase [Candidatus Berkelbacteria bacterium]
MKRSELFFSVLLLPIDAAMIVVSFVVAYYLRIKAGFLPVESNVSFRQYLLYVLYLLPFWLLIFALNGLYKISRNRNYFNDLYKIFYANAFVLLSFIVIIFFGRAFFFSRLILVLVLLISVIAVFLGRLIVTEFQRYLYRFGWGVHRIIIIGNNEVSQTLANKIKSEKKLGLKFAGIVNGLGAGGSRQSKILGNVDDLPEIIKKYHPDEIILTDVSINREKILDIIQACSDANISFKFISDVFSIVTTATNASVLGGYPVMELKTVALDGWGRIAKRIFDIIAATISLLIISPIYILIAIIIKITSRGPIYFRQQRVGRDGKSFTFYKFRSMYTDLCDWTEKGKKWTTAADTKTRVTPIGRILRKTSLDEIPQFYNVLKGDMSFVGPRPELPAFVEKFQKEIPDYFRRHRVKSGLTGWAQVNGLKGDTSIPERIRFDIFYIESWSFWFDLKIIIRTILLIIGEAFGGKYEYRDRS